MAGIRNMTPRRSRPNKEVEVVEPDALDLKLHFSRIGETKGTFKYSETDGPEGDILESSNFVVGTLYIRKDALKGKPSPEHLTMTIKG